MQRALRTGMLLLLLLPIVALVAQEHTIVPVRKIDLMDGTAKRGELIYQVILMGGKDRGSNRYDFTGEDKAVLRIDLRIVGRSERWKARSKVGIGERSYRGVRQGPWRPVSGPKVINEGETTRQLVFETTRPGSGGFTLPVTFLDTEDPGWESEANWQIVGAGNRIVVPKLTIVGLTSEEDLEWERIRGKFPEMIAYVLNPAGGTKYVGEARTMIRNRTDSDFTNWVTKSSKAGSVQRFVTRYAAYENRGFITIDKRLKAAREKLTATYRTPVVEPPPPPSIAETSAGDGSRSRALTNWRQAIGSRDTAQLGEYLRNYGGLIPVNDSTAVDSIACWTEPSYRVLGQRAGRERIQLVNFVAPAYYDIYGGWVDIDDRKLIDEQLLSVDIHRGGALDLLIVDKACPEKQVTVALDNLMNASLTVDSSLDVFHFTFEGGNPPYTLRIFGEVGATEWSREDITERELRIEASTLRSAGLSGSYRAEAFSTGSLSPVAVSGGRLTVAERATPTWLLVVLTLLVVAGFAVLLVYILRRGGRHKRTIFDEA